MLRREVVIELTTCRARSGICAYGGARQGKKPEQEEVCSAANYGPVASNIQWYS